MITPLGERVLLKPIVQETKTKGGIYIPESAKEEKKEGIVEAVGSKDGAALPLKVGERVLYGGYSNDEFEIEGKKYIILEFKDILAKLE